MLVAEITFGYVAFHQAPVMIECVALGNVGTVALGYYFLVKVAGAKGRIDEFRCICVRIPQRALVAQSSARRWEQLVWINWGLWRRFWKTMIVWWQADVIGILIVTPLLIEVLHRPNWRFRNGLGWSFLAVLATVCATRSCWS